MALGQDHPEKRNSHFWTSWAENSGMRKLSSEALKHPGRRLSPGKKGHPLPSFPQGWKPGFVRLCCVFCFCLFCLVWCNKKWENLQSSNKSKFQLTISSLYFLLSTGIELTTLKEKKNGKWLELILKVVCIQTWNYPPHHTYNTWRQGQN